LYFPAAFDEKSCALIELLVPKRKRIAVEEWRVGKFAEPLAQCRFYAGDHAFVGVHEGWRRGQVPDA
jgi:hypothetical protein